MVNQLIPFSEKTFYFMNAGSMGDCIAAAPILKYAIDTFHTPRNQEYRVGMCKEYRSVFHFIPDDKIVYIRAWEYDTSLYGFDDYVVRPLVFNTYDNKPRNVGVQSVAKHHLMHQASLGLLSRIVDLKDFPYIPFEYVSVDHFSVDWNKAVILSVVSPETHRAWPAEEILKTAEAIRDMGLIPVYVGKTGKAVNTEIRNLDFEYPGFGVDLVNKTSIQELATIMAKSRAVLGVDSGPMHIAMTTNVPVIFAATTIRPELRIPHRNATTITIIPDEVACRFCHSDWNLVMNKCPRNLDIPECVTAMTADKFISALTTIIPNQGEVK